MYPVKARTTREFDFTILVRAARRDTSAISDGRGAIGGRAVQGEAIGGRAVRRAGNNGSILSQAPDRASRSWGPQTGTRAYRGPRPSVTLIGAPDRASRLKLYDTKNNPLFIHLVVKIM